MNKSEFTIEKPIALIYINGYYAKVGNESNSDDIERYVSLSVAQGLQERLNTVQSNYTVDIMEKNELQQEKKELLEALKEIAGIEAFINDGEMKILFQKTVYPLLIAKIKTK